MFVGNSFIHSFRCLIGNSEYILINPKVTVVIWMNS
jgi:hypothetical protein